MECGAVVETLPRHFHLTLRATLMNLTDAQREYVRGYPLPGRTWTLNASFDL